MKMLFRKTALASLIVFSFFLSYKGAYYVGDRFFYDKLFLQKSPEHGYCWVKENKNCQRREQDYFSIRNVNENVLGAVDDQQFKIAVIGDSYVWGLGVREEQTVSKVLAKKLKRAGADAEVIPVGYPGNSLVDYYSDYKSVVNLYNPDLVIFVLVMNDSFIMKNNYDHLLFSVSDIMNPCLLEHSDVKPEIMYDHLWETEQKMIDDAWENPLNVCWIEAALEKMPKDDAIYFITDEYWPPYEKRFQRYRHFLDKYEKEIFSATAAKDKLKYKRYFYPEVSQRLFVSEIEDHPSAIAHEIYAELLSEKILETYSLR